MEALLKYLITPAITLILAGLGGAMALGRMSQKTKEQDKRIMENSKALAKKVDLEECKDDMERGSVRFKALNEKLEDVKKEQKKQGEVLASVKTAVTFIAGKHGFPMPND